MLSHSVTLSAYSREVGEGMELQFVHAAAGNGKPSRDVRAVMT